MSNMLLFIKWKDFKDYIIWNTCYSNSYHREMNAVLSIIGSSSDLRLLIFRYHVILIFYSFIKGFQSDIIEAKKKESLSILSTDWHLTKARNNLLSQATRLFK